MRLNGSPDLSTLLDSEGRRWLDFRKSLNINYRILLGNIFIAWLMLASGFYFLTTTFAQSTVWLSVPFLAFWTAYWLTSYTSHFHEAAHFNLLRNRKWNDVLANVFLMPFIGLEIKSYRKSHWRHHLHLGTPQDTEISYIQPLSARTMIEGLTGVFLLKSGYRYLSTYRGRVGAGSTARSSDSLKFVAAVFCFLAMQCFVSIFLYWLIGLQASLVWLLGNFVVSPFLVIIRQTLEHRSLAALPDIDYFRQELPPVNRLFGTGFFASHFGGAGFNRHLLHHWDPGVSYTCFNEMERFLLDTTLGTQLEAARTTYGKALVRMLQRA
jgi:fatty acid desaturase